MEKRKTTDLTDEEKKAKIKERRRKTAKMAAFVREALDDFLKNASKGFTEEQYEKFIEEIESEDRPVFVYEVTKKPYSLTLQIAVNENLITFSCEYPYHCVNSAQMLNMLMHVNSANGLHEGFAYSHKNDNPIYERLFYFPKGWEENPESTKDFITYYFVMSKMSALAVAPSFENVVKKEDEKFMKFLKGWGYKGDYMTPHTPSKGKSKYIN